MAQLLIYETAVPVSSARHAKYCVDSGGGYAFMKGVNSVPLMAVEFLHAAAEYAIIFAGALEDAMPAAILGARRGENVYLSDEGKWQASYIPAFVRRYPFVFAASEDGKTFTLCVDEAFSGLNDQGRGEALFTADRKPSAYTERTVKFQQEYRSEFERTRRFCSRLRELDLLVPMQAQFNLANGEKLSLAGFSVVDRGRLRSLADDVLAGLARNGELELIHLHLQSVRNFEALRRQLRPLVATDRAKQPAPA